MKVYVITEYDANTDQESRIAVYENEKEANDFTNQLWLDAGGRHRRKTWCIEEFELITQTPVK